MVLTAPKDIQEVENYLLLKAMRHGKLNMRQWQLLLMPCLNMSKVAKLRKKVLMKQVLLMLILLTVLRLKIHEFFS
jgi:hypothetical protein